MSGPYIPLTDAIRALIVAAIRDGNFRTDAARAGGVSLDKLRSWEKEHPDFATEMQAAEIESTGTLIQAIRTGATEDWRAAAWLLERRNENWASNADKLKARELDQPKQAPIQINVAQQAALQARLAEYEPLQLPSHADAAESIVAPANGIDDDDDAGQDESE